MSMFLQALGYKEKTQHCLQGLRVKTVTTFPRLMNSLWGFTQTFGEGVTRRLAESPVRHAEML